MQFKMLGVEAGEIILEIILRSMLNFSVIAVSETVCHRPNTTTCHHQLGDDSRYLGVTMEFWHTFCKDEKTKSAPKFHCYPRVS